MERWFTKGFRERSRRRWRACKKCSKHRARWLSRLWRRGSRHGSRALLAKITAPTLVIAGKRDPATPLEGNEFIRQHIPGAAIAVLEAAHLANVEQPKAYTDTVLGFLLGK